MTIAFVHNQALPYRHFLFSALARRFPIDWFLFNQRREDVPPDCSVTILAGYRVPGGSDLWVQPGLRRALQRRPYRLIVGGDLGAWNTAVAYRVARRTGTPFVPWVLEWDRIRHPRRMLRTGFERRLLRDAGAVIAPGIRHARYLQRRGVRPERIVRVPNCTDFAVTPPPTDGALFAELSALRAEGRRIVAAVGRHVAFKGHDQLIRAQALLEAGMGEGAPHLVIGGDGPLLDRNRQLAEQLGVRRIRFVERFLDGDAKRVLYTLCDVFALTSTRLRAFEPWGLVCNEAAAYGRPIVVTDAVGAAEEVVRHGENGYVVPDREPSVLAEHLRTLLLDAPTREAFGRRSAEIAAEYRPEVMVERFTELLSRFAERA